MPGKTADLIARTSLFVKVACATLFLLFTFAWLYFFQADMLTVAQHGLSGGQTHYDRTIGAVIITAVLMVLQLLVYAFTRVSRYAHALSYLPSFLLLGFISSISYPFHWGAWLWGGPLTLVLWVAAVVAAKKIPFYPRHLSVGLFSRAMWANLLQMALMMLGVAAVSNTNAIDHFKAHAEVALMQGDADEALSVGQQSLETDPSLTMLRIFALSQKGQLGERLFEYAIAGKSLDMLPRLLGSQSQLQVMPDSLLWAHFGVHPDSIVVRADQEGMKPVYGGKLAIAQYLDSLATDSLATTAYQDYLLTGCLIDRQLDSFAVRLPRYYALDADSLPRHYREALVLYQQEQLRGDTLFIYKDSLMLQRWHDFQQYDSIYPDRRERKIRTEEEFRGTYWYYYF